MCVPLALPLPSPSPSRLEASSILVGSAYASTNDDFGSEGMNQASTRPPLLAFCDLMVNAQLVKMRRSNGGIHSRACRVIKCLNHQDLGTPTRRMRPKMEVIPRSTCSAPELVLLRCITSDETYSLTIKFFRRHSLSSSSPCVGVCVLF